jgi:endogenous inhibitor of DNA gyrase (YacG/DUF329 family)
MPMLKVRCANCDALIPTGTEMSYEAFRASTFQQRTVECPDCEHIHTWTQDDVDQSVFKEKS